MAAGDLSASALLQVRLKAEAMWNDAQYASEFKPQAGAAEAVLKNQTARITPLESQDKDLTVGITWIQTCDVAVEDCETNCDLDEPELETKRKDYALDVCKKTGFSIDREKNRTNSYTREEEMARGLAASVKVLDEFWAQKVLASLQAFAGVNVDPAPFTFDAADLETDIPAADYNQSMIPYLIRMGIKNRMASPYFIDGGNLYVNWLNTQFNAGNLDGKGDKARVDAIKMYFDLFNFGASGVTAETFMINQAAVAMATRNRHGDAPTLIGGSVQQTLYTIPSIALPNVKYDVFYTVKCVTVNGKAHYKDVWRVQTEGGVFLNPEGCPVTIGEDTFNPTGVLAFNQVP